MIFGGFVGTVRQETVFFVPSSAVVVPAQGSKELLHDSVTQS